MRFLNASFVNILRSRRVFNGADINTYNLSIGFLFNFICVQNGLNIYFEEDLYEIFNKTSLKRV